MKIYLTSGKGIGKTPLSAFDCALKDAGIYNYNLIILSSIIPPQSIITHKKFVSPRDEHGHKLYIIKAEMRSRETGKYIGAALGWLQLEDGRGIFVEHEAIGETKAAVESMLQQEVKDSLTDLCIFRKYPVAEKNFKIKMNVMKVEGSPSSVLVLAVYKSEGWD